MVLILTADALKAAFDLLCATPPFNKWNLPYSDEVKFKTDKSKDTYAWHTFDGKKHTICVSISSISSIDLLIRKMAHEMVHVHEANVRRYRNDVQHSAAWNKWADQVCAVHGFDRKAF